MENKLVDFGSVHPDVKRYLDHDCYCPGEIYDFTGIWAMVYKADDKCTVIENDGNTSLIGNHRGRNQRHHLLEVR